MNKRMIVKCWGVNLVQSDGLPWNAWEAKIGEDRTWYFSASGWWRALKHLAECEDCRRENNLSLQDVTEQLDMIEGEWNKDEEV